MKKESKKLLIPYITAGYPTRKFFLPILHKLSSLGVDYIEVGVPHSDPLADGPVIQHSSKVALEQGVSLKWILNSCKKLSPKKIKPLILFSYFNPVFEYGLERLLKELPKPLFYGLIIPDLPFDEAKKYISIFKKYGLNLILLAAPTTKSQKIKNIAKYSNGLIYLVSVIGVTGERKKISSNVKKKIMEIKKYTRKPVVVGFGIGNSKQAKHVLSFGADGVVIGSAIIKLLQGKNNLILKKLEKYIKSFNLH
ncbi:MAG: tryptophan synthase subunit alpha [Candidatus Melainabacteria bacterium]|nr:tryptophan synthase subunit alpha [Candidatus Melainabacteria bacterium]